MERLIIEAAENDNIHDVTSMITLAKYYWENITTSNSDDGNNKDTKDKNKLIALRWILKAAYYKSEESSQEQAKSKFDTDFELEFEAKQVNDDDDDEEEQATTEDDNDNNHIDNDNVVGQVQHIIGNYLFQLMKNPKAMPLCIYWFRQSIKHHRGISAVNDKKSDGGGDEIGSSINNNDDSNNQQKQKQQLSIYQQNSKDIMNHIIENILKLQCEYCGLESSSISSANKLFKCTQCNGAYYCSKKCQRNAWKLYHKQYCSIPNNASFNKLTVNERINYFLDAICNTQN